MARVPIVAVSAASAFVLFLGTSLGLLAAQGRLGSILGGAPSTSNPSEESHGKNGDTASQPAGAESHGDPVKSAGAGKHADGEQDPKQGAIVKPDSVKGESAGAESGHGTSAKFDLGSVKSDTAHGAAQSVKGTVTPPAPVKRIATASLVQNFQLPEPFTARELEDLVAALRENRDAHDLLTEQLAVQKAANERDRLDLEARFGELDGFRKKLEQQKTEVTAKVTELAKRNDQLTAGEEKYVKHAVARLATLKPDEAKTQLLLEDDALAARILHKMEPKACAKILVSLPAEKSVALTKLLRSISLAEAESMGAPESKDGNK